MAKPEMGKWCSEWHARRMIADALHYEGPRSSDAYVAFLDALRDGDIKARLKRDLDDCSLSKFPRDLDPSFWTGETDGRPNVPLDQIQLRGIIEIDVGTVSNWLHPGADGRKRGPGRKTVFDWEGMWIELVLRANTPDGLDPDVNITELAIDMHQWFETSGVNPPDTRTIEKKLARYFEQQEQRRPK